MTNFNLLVNIHNEAYKENEKFVNQIKKDLDIQKKIYNLGIDVSLLRFIYKLNKLDEIKKSTNADYKKYISRDINLSDLLLS